MPIYLNRGNGKWAWPLNNAYLGKYPRFPCLLIKINFHSFLHWVCNKKSTYNFIEKPQMKITNFQ